MAKLSKGLLKRDYVDNKLNSYEMAKKYNCTATWINMLRKYYNIKTLKKYERNIKQKLSKKQQMYIYGKLLGDGSIKFGGRKGNKNAFLSIYQKDKYYVQWQYCLMKDFVRAKIKVYSNKYNNRNPMYYFNTISHPIFTSLYDKIYPDAIKTVSNAWLNQLAPFSLAVWYMDDGSITQSNHQMRISTESFGYHEHLLIQKYFKGKWNIKVDIKKSSRENKYILSFSAKERDKFFKLIMPYILPQMKYKIYISRGEWIEWTVSEVNYLKRNYLSWRTNWKKALQTLGHSKDAIQRKASYLALTRKNKLWIC